MKSAIENFALWAVATAIVAIGLALSERHGR